MSWQESGSFGDQEDPTDVEGFMSSSWCIQRKTWSIGRSSLLFSQVLMCIYRRGGRAETWLRVGNF